MNWEMNLTWDDVWNAQRRLIEAMFLCSYVLGITGLLWIALIVIGHAFGIHTAVGLLATAVWASVLVVSVAGGAQACKEWCDWSIKTIDNI